jgi:putative autotransporter adhesin-like protein
MKIIKYLFLAILTFVFLAGYAQKSETRNPGSFDEISVGEAIDVYLVPGNEEKLLVEVKNADLDDIETEVLGGRLEIKMRRGNYNNAEVTVTVTYKELHGIEVSSAAGVFTKGTLKTNKLKVEVSSAGKADLDIIVESLEAEVSSAGDIILEGTCDELDLSVSSAGEFDGKDLKSNRADVNVSSGGGAKVSVINEINARASSGGSIRYYGNPKKEHTSSSSGGSIRKS